MARFNEIVDDLKEKMADAIREWTGAVQDLDDPDAADIGATVLDNLQNDEQFEGGPFRGFVEALAASVNAGSCRSSYEDVCNKFQKRGPEATIAKELSLHRLTRRRDLVTRIAVATGWPVDEADDQYDTLKLIEESSRRQLLSQVTFNRGELVWGGFHQGLKGEDPIEGMTATRAKQTLGLGEEWYPPGEPVVRLEYLPPSDMKRLVPTVADAGWNRYWMPAPAGTGFGLTRDLAETGKTPGRGEVVHDQGTLDWLVSPCIPDEVPE
jgi:hypothetical protein